MVEPLTEEQLKIIEDATGNSSLSPEEKHALMKTANLTPEQAQAYVDAKMAEMTDEVREDLVDA